MVGGKPGSGKSTATKLAAELIGNIYYFSMGDEIRARGLDGKASIYKDELELLAEDLRQSKPVPAHLASGVFEECIEQSPYDRILVDGYPQHYNRLPGFNESLEKVGGKVLAVFKIDVDDQTASQRLKTRTKRFVEVGENDDAYIDHRLKQYRENIAPALDILAEQYPMHVIDGARKPEGVAKSIVDLVGQYTGVSNS